MKLIDQNCEPITAGTSPLSAEATKDLLQQVPAWTVGDKEMARDYRFATFQAAMKFVNDVASIADAQDHHPDILISYNKVRLTLSTHKIGGLSMNDFIVASKIDALSGNTRDADQV